MPMVNILERWMWSDACWLMSQVERLPLWFIGATRAQSVAIWEPPVDILELAQEIVIITALPGVASETIEVAIDGNMLFLSGRRERPVQLKDAVIHRLELPSGVFARQVALPSGRYRGVRHEMRDGCLIVTADKIELTHG